MIAQLNGISLAYDDQGRGTPLVMLHGFPHDRTLWTQQRIALGRRARCIVPDLRGFGESTAVVSGSPLSMDQFADDVAALLDEIEVEQAVICGLSMGGYIAMAMWRRHPDRFLGLVLCDTRANADTDTARAARNDMIAMAKAGGAKAIADKQLPGMVGKSTRARRPEAVTSLQAMMERQPVTGIVGALEALRDRPDSQETLASVTVPTMIVVGDEDVITPPSDAETMMALLPAVTEARLEVIAAAGHVSCYERPSAVTHVLAEFLVRLTAGRD